MLEKHFNMEENLKVDEKFRKAFNLGYELAKELGLKKPMFPKEGSDITLKSPMQAGIFQFVQDKQAVINNKINNGENVVKIKTVKKTFGQNKNEGKGLTP